MRGEWVEVDSEKLREALAHWQQIEQQVGAEGVSFIEGMRLLAGASADLKENEAIHKNASWVLVEAGESLRETLTGLRTPDGLTGPPPPGFHGKAP